ncbi:MAG: hypothetical protein K0S46_1425 [Moraxellaceae bacterium]|jgi:uncharacterized protein|nr:hypothetical protein [Moraxellaceae bacterium]
MGKLVQLILLVAIAWFALRYLQRKPILPGQEGANPAGDGSTSPVMRRCAHCNVHVPEGESTQSRGQFFCCEAHRDAYFKGNTR